jgi:hypothetical protein
MEDMTAINGKKDAGEMTDRAMQDVLLRNAFLEDEIQIVRARKDHFENAVADLLHKHPEIEADVRRVMADAPRDSN